MPAGLLVVCVATTAHGAYDQGVARAPCRSLTATSISTYKQSGGLSCGKTIFKSSEMKKENKKTKRR